MCGVFGFISKDGRKPDLKRLERMAITTERRGPHAFGFAWIDSRNRLRMFKQTGRISDSLPLLAMAADAKAIIGHCRWATQGDYNNNLNNHPHPCDGGWIAHNGQIPHYRQLIDRHDLFPTTDCDSEVLGLMVEQFNGSLKARCAAAVEQAFGRPAVMLGLWNKPGRLIIAKAGNPLMIGDTKSGTYFASLRMGLPRNARDFPDQTVREYNITRPDYGKEETVQETRPRINQARGAAKTGTRRRSPAQAGVGKAGGEDDSLFRRAGSIYGVESERTYGF